MADHANELCVLCLEVIPEKTKPEHVLLNALGGRMTVSKVICPNCNQRMGNGPDNDRAASVAHIRNYCGLKAGDGDPPPKIAGEVSSNGERFDLEAGLQPVMKPSRPLMVDISDDEIKVKIETYNEKQEKQLINAAARKIAKHFGKEHDAVIDAIAKDISKDRHSAIRPAPEVHKSLNFGSGLSQQSMAKAALVLWAKKVGNAEVATKKYDVIRQFINDGQKPDDPEDIIKIDTRELPNISKKFGLNPNIIWVGSNNNGEVFGYFRLYGAIGWRISICKSDAPNNKSNCLISNPIDNKNWDCFEDSNSIFSNDWIWAEWKTWPPNFEAVVQRLNPLFEHGQNYSREVMLINLIKGGLQSAGLKEGDIITKEHAPALSQYVGKRLAAYILQIEIPD